MVRVKKFFELVVADALGIDRGTVGDWLDAYDRYGPDYLADATGPGRPSFVPRDELKKIVGEVKQFTAYGFVDLVEKKAGVKYNKSCAPPAEVARLFGQESSQDCQPSPA